MAKVEIFDPSMCCSTGVCGTDVDPTLSRFAADIEWLATQGVVVQRATLAQEPGKFAANVAVRNALVINGTGVLPAVVVDGVLKSTGAYPAREEMAGLTLRSSVSWRSVGKRLPATKVQSRIASLRKDRTVSKPRWLLPSLPSDTRPASVLLCMPSSLPPSIVGFGIAVPDWDAVSTCDVLKFMVGPIGNGPTKDGRPQKSTESPWSFLMPSCRIPTPWAPSGSLHLWPPCPSSRCSSP
jgi:hypothetical protein